MNRLLLLSIMLPLAACSQGPQWVLPSQPYVIAHRGASSYEPEHTAQAYRLAKRMQSDLIEPDVVFTRDRIAICAHDITMESTTDVESMYPDRARADGSWYWVDFDLEEIRKLNKEGRARNGSQINNGPYRVMTLDEMLELVAAWSFRPVDTVGWRRFYGVIPELKHPEFHREQLRGFDPAAVLIESLRPYQTEKPQRIGEPWIPVIVIQCFDLNTIEHLATLTDLPLVWLTGDEPTTEELDRAQAVAQGLGPNRNLLENADGSPTPLLAEAAARGLALYPYTFKDEPEATERFFHTHGVSGLFTDNPDVGVTAKNARN